MKIIVTTSNKYHHLLPIFCYLFNKNWSPNQEVEIVGYDTPINFALPSNFSFHSLGKQTENKKDFSNDLKPYFEIQPSTFCWLFDDTFCKLLSEERLRDAIMLSNIPNVGRVNLSGECVKQDHTQIDAITYANTQTAKYRLSTQPSIWNKKFLLQYLNPNLSPWDFESQHPVNDGWKILGFDRDNAPLQHNEGVTRHDIYKYDLTGIPEEQINEMKQLGIL